MKKLLSTFIIVGALFAANSVSAQSPVGLRMVNIGFETGFALEDFYTIPLGATIQYEMPVGNQIHAFATAGYITVQGEELDGANVPSYNYVPLKAGIKYYATSNLYIDGEIGAGIGTNEGAETEFLWAPGVGYQFPVADDRFVDLSARFENIGKFSSLGIRLGYSFGL